jgi:hypothetical protein
LRYKPIGAALGPKSDPSSLTVRLLGYPQPLLWRNEMAAFQTKSDEIDRDHVGGFFT